MLDTSTSTPMAGVASGRPRPVRLHVERSSPARRLYGRLGFHQLADQGVHLLLEHEPVS